jgi:IS605 OrfB family transposase
VAGVDLGEVHIAAITTTPRHALVLSGRQLRACKQGRNRTHSILQAKLSRCQRGSKRWQRLLTCKAQASAKLYRQQREILHQAARKAMDFCQAEGVTRLAVGDVRDIQTGVSLGRVSNQKISQWPHGQFVRYLTEKAQQVGISVEWIDESHSTRTCSYSGHVRSSSARERRFRCPGCGARVHRDVNGANNICSKAVHGAYAKVQADTVTYRRPIVVVPRRRPRHRRARSSTYRRPQTRIDGSSSSRRDTGQSSWRKPEPPGGSWGSVRRRTSTSCTLTKHPLPGRYTHSGWDGGVLGGLSVPACTLRRQMHCRGTRTIG